MKVLITGGAGFIGTATAETLLSAGHLVRIFDNLETGIRSNMHPDAEFIEGDIRDAEALRTATQGCDAVIHLAAMVSVPLSVADPVKCWDVNVQGTRNVLSAARAAKCRRVVLASTAAIYGNNPSLPKSESMLPEPASPYASSKLMNEVDAAYYSRYLNLETACLRFFNVYGPRQQPNSPYSGVISKAGACLLSGTPFTVFGTGEQTRDFVFVYDVAAAILAALTQPGVSGEVINIGSGRQTSLMDLLGMMGKAVGRTLSLSFDSPRAGDVLHSVADVSRLSDELSFQAKLPLEEGLKQTLDWMRSDHPQGPHSRSTPNVELRTSN